MLRDSDIRVELRAGLDRLYSHDDLVVEEMVATGTRIDVAVINGEINGYEIKSDRDDVSRLPRQTAAYDRICDMSTAVVTERHLAAVQELVPPHWGITLATTLDDAVTLEPVRDSTPNPALDAEGLAQLLWRDELLAVLEAHDLVHGHRSKPRYRLFGIVATLVPLPELRDVVRDTLKGRTEWRVVPSPASCGA